jgi:ornithine--oxo-acid transaminase
MAAQQGNFFQHDATATTDFGPYMPGYEIIAYNDFACLKKSPADKTVCGFLFEPIQGEAGVVVPMTVITKE